MPFLNFRCLNLNHCVNGKEKKETAPIFFEIRIPKNKELLRKVPSKIYVSNFINDALIWTKNSKERTKRSETGQFFLWPTKKNEKLTGQFIGQETDQNHMDVPNDQISKNF